MKGAPAPTPFRGERRSCEARHSHGQRSQENRNPDCSGRGRDLGIVVMGVGVEAVKLIRLSHGRQISERAET